jgi:hypothetical protein
LLASFVALRQAHSLSDSPTIVPPTSFDGSIDQTLIPSTSAFPSILSGWSQSQLFA